jgi:hypothetical protein
MHAVRSVLRAYKWEERLLWISVPIVGLKPGQATISA